MDFDPSSPLNLAHMRERQAEDHVKAERFDSAVDVLGKAAGKLFWFDSLRKSFNESPLKYVTHYCTFLDSLSFLIVSLLSIITDIISGFCMSFVYLPESTTTAHFKDALNLTTNTKARESIQSQIQRCQLQIDLVKKKKQLALKRMEDNCRKRDLLSQQQQVKSAGKMVKNLALEDGGNIVKDGLELRIIQAMKEHDSLLQVLLEKQECQSPSGTTDKDQFNGGVSASSSSSSLNASYQTGSRRPKGDKTIIEELKTSNEQLRQLINQLVSQLETLQLENQLLTKEIAILKSEQANRDTCSLPQLPPLEPPKILY
jgi:hypothetical protein